MRYTGHHTTHCPAEGCNANLTVLPYYHRNGAPSSHMFTVHLFDPAGRGWHTVCPSYDVDTAAEHYARMHTETHGA